MTYWDWGRDQRNNIARDIESCGSGSLYCIIIKIYMYLLVSMRVVFEFPR